MMREIYLSRGLVTLVDDDDHAWLSQWKWCANATAVSKKLYAFRTDRKSKSAFSMHRLILGLEKGDGICGDHINGDSLDNRRSNLRIATKQQNLCNVPRQANNKSGFKGVCWNKCHKAWMAQIGANGSKIFLGHYPSPEEAHAAYRIAAEKYHGKFAYKEAQ